MYVTPLENDKETVERATGDVRHARRRYHHWRRGARLRLRNCNDPLTKRFYTVPYCTACCSRTKRTLT
jgi:hypothetical protein